MSEQSMAMEQTSLLNVPTETAVRDELSLGDPQSISVIPGVDPELEKNAEDFIARVMAYNPSDPAQLDHRETNIAAVESLGAKTQKEAAWRSAMLKQPIRSLAARSEDGGEVARSLVELNVQVEELDPGKFDFEPGWFGRVLGMIPGIGNPIKKYFIKFEEADTIIDAIIRSLNNGREQLKRDNSTLALDQKTMRMLTLRLRKTIQLGMIIDQRLNHILEREVGPEDPRHKFISEELLFPLRQRIVDLQQQLAVNQQGVLAVELIIRNNKELIKGVDRAINVTVNALTTAVTVALALANQKVVLDKIYAVNATTNRLIEQTAAQLKDQGVAIQKQAAGAQLSIESLAKAFNDIHQALDDIAAFRKKALPTMAQNILNMEQMTSDAEAKIRRMEQGNLVAPSIFLDVEE